MLRAIKHNSMIKKEIFDTELQELASFAKAISHPARLAILKYLAETKTCISGDISDELPLSRTTVNQHLKELKDAGLIQGHVEGVKTNYCLNVKVVEKATKLLNEFLAELKLPENFKCQ